MSGRQNAATGDANVNPPASATEDVNRSVSAGSSEPPLYWSVLHHKNLHDESHAVKVKDGTVSASAGQNEVPPNGKPHEVPAVIHERQPLLGEVSTRSSALTGFGSTSSSPRASPTLPEHPSSSGKRASQWVKVREAVNSHELLIHHIPDASNGSRGKISDSDRRWSDLGSITSYELTLRECLFLFIALLTIGVLAYSFLFEHWSIIDALYFTTCILTTVGYGDLTPTTTAGKLFGSMFALAGIVLLGLALGVVGSQLVEAEINYTQNMRNRTARVLERAFTRKGSRHTKEESAAHDTDSTDGSLSRSCSNSSLESLDSIASDSTCGSMYDPESGTERSDSSGNPAHRHRRRKRKARRRCEWLFVVHRHLPGILPMVIGGITLALLENWMLSDSIYYIIVTATTIGFGDFAPRSEISKAVAILFVPIAVASMGYILGNVASFIVERRRAEYTAKLWMSSELMKVEDIEALDEARDGGVSELEYIKFMLVAMKKVDGELFDKLRDQFVEMDLTGDQCLCLLVGGLYFFCCEDFSRTRLSLIDRMSCFIRPLFIGDGQITKNDLRLMAARKLKRVDHKLKLREYKHRLAEQASLKYGFTDALRLVTLQPRASRRTVTRRPFERSRTVQQTNSANDREYSTGAVRRNYLNDVNDRTTDVIRNF